MINKKEFSIIRMAVANIFAVALTIARGENTLDAAGKNSIRRDGFELADLMLEDFKKEVVADESAPVA